MRDGSYISVAHPPSVGAACARTNPSLFPRGRLTAGDGDLVAPVCSNCGASDFVWANELKTGSIGGGSLSLRARGELSMGTRLCRSCGHADLFLKDPSILKMPHTWKPGEFVPIPARPAVVPAPSAPTPAPPPPPPVSPSPVAPQPTFESTPPQPSPTSSEPMGNVPGTTALAADSSTSSSDGGGGRRSSRRRSKSKNSDATTSDSDSA